MADIREDFLRAIKNIQDGTPTRKLLKERQDRGQLKINYWSVACEAGHARGNIGYDGCAYDDIRKIITELMKNAIDPDANCDIGKEGGDHSVNRTRPSLQRIIERLRLEKKLLKEEKEILASQLASATNFIASLEKTLGRTKSDTARKERQANNFQKEETPEGREL